MQDLLMSKLEDYASEPGKSAMELVLFRYTLLAFCACNTFFHKHTIASCLGITNG